MGALSKLQPLIIVVTAVVGVLLGLNPAIANFSSRLIEPSLMILLFFIFLSVDFSGIKDALKNIKLVSLSLVINFVWTPVVAMVLAKVALGEFIDVQIGFVMLLVTPCTDWYLAFTKMAKGNVEAGAALLPINLVLQVVLLPVYLFIFIGGSIAFDPATVLSSIGLVLGLPLVCAIVTRVIFGRLKKGHILSEMRDQKNDLLQLVFLCIAVCAMFASQGDLALANTWVFLLLLLPLSIFFMGNYVLATAVGKLAKFSYRDTVTLTFTTLARNSPLALAIAISVFTSQPMIGLTLVIGPLIELPILALVTFLLKKKINALDISKK